MLGGPQVGRLGESGLHPWDGRHDRPGGHRVGCGIRALHAPLQHRTRWADEGSPCTARLALLCFARAPPLPACGSGPAVSRRRPVSTCTSWWRWTRHGACHACAADSVGAIAALVRCRGSGSQPVLRSRQPAPPRGRWAQTDAGARAISGHRPHTWESVGGSPEHRFQLFYRYYRIRACRRCADRQQGRIPPAE